MAIIIHGENMCTREAAHAELARSLEFPDYYGANLDALWDCITCAEAELVLQNPTPMLNALEEYGCKLLQTLFEATKENEDFRFSLEA